MCVPSDSRYSFALGAVPPTLLDQKEEHIKAGGTKDPTTYSEAGVLSATWTILC